MATLDETAVVGGVTVRGLNGGLWTTGDGDDPTAEEEDLELTADEVPAAELEATEVLVVCGSRSYGKADNEASLVETKLEEPAVELVAPEPPVVCGVLPACCCTEATLADCVNMEML